MDFYKDLKDLINIVLEHGEYMEMNQILKLEDYLCGED